MTDTEPVLVGVDDSSASSAAVRYAGNEARRLGTDLHLVHVVPVYVPMAPMHPLVSSDLERTGRAILDAAVSQAHQVLDPGRVRATLLSGPRVAALHRASEASCLVVLGSEQRSLIDQMITGSVLYGVAASAACPVVAVPSDWSPTDEHHRIVAGLKSAEHAFELLRYAFRIAADRGAGVRLMHAWELPGVYDDLITSRVDADEWRTRATNALEACLTDLRKAYPGVPVDIQVVHGQPARVLRTASEGADLLLVARRRGLLHFNYLGGTVRALLREGRCPIEVVPPPAVTAETVGAMHEEARTAPR